MRRRRESAGLTLVQFAERSGLTPGYLSSIERGQRDPSLSTIGAIASGLAISISELFGNVAQPNPAEAADDDTSTTCTVDTEEALLRFLRATSGRH